MANRRCLRITWGGILLIGMLMANGAMAEGAQSASDLQCAATKITESPEFLTLFVSSSGAWVLKTPPSKYLVKNSYYALCFDLSNVPLTPNGALNKRVVIGNTFGVPVLIDGLKIALPDVANSTKPVLTITGPSPVIVRNSKVTGSGGVGSVGLSLKNTAITLEQVEVAQVERGVTIESPQPVIITNSKFTGTDSAQSQGFVMTESPVTLTAVTVNKFATGITVSGQQMVTLIGSTTITGTLNKGQTGLQINGDNVVMQGGKISNFTTGVILGGKGNTISGTIITRDAPAENTIGIALQGTDLSWICT